MDYKEIISQLYSLNVDVCTKEEIAALFSNYGKAGSVRAKYSPPPTNEHLPNLIVRATTYNSNDEVVNSVNRIQYPPPAKNTKYQRASTPENPMFYGTLNRGPDFQDVRPALKICFMETFKNYNHLLENNDSIVFSLWNVEKPLLLFSVFNQNDFTSQDPEMAEISKAYQEFLKVADPELIDKTHLLLNYITQRFAIPVEINENEYKPSGIISQHIIDAFNSKNYELDGVIFKSTRSDKYDFNIAIRPLSCDNKLRCVKAIDCKLSPDKKAIGKVVYSINEDDNQFEYESDSDFILDLDE